MKRIIVIAIAAIAFLSGISASAQVQEQGWKVKLNGGYYASDAGSYTDHVGIGEFGFGYQINRFFYIGAQTGVWGPVDSQKGKGAIWQLPLRANCELTIPTDSRFTPLVDVNVGLTATSFGGVKDANPQYSIIEVLPGLAIRLTKGISLQANAGYLKMTKSGTLGRNQNNLEMKAGLVFNL